MNWKAAGERLFSRSRQGAELTAAGARFLQDAGRVLDALNVLGRTVASDSEALPAPLHIGALPTTLVSLVAPVVVGLQQQSPLAHAGFDAGQRCADDGGEIRAINLRDRAYVRPLSHGGAQFRAAVS